jgi:RES domain-containing protein
MAYISKQQQFMLVYRLQQLKYSQSREDILLGEAAKRLGGRWSKIGTPLIYTAATPELALLEVLVHLEGTPPEDMPPLAIITLQIPDESILKLRIEDLPQNWKEVPPPSSLQDFTKKWIDELQWFALQMPSAVMPKSNNYLLNPVHKSIKDVNIIEVETFSLDSRLLIHSRIDKIEDIYKQMTGE